MAPRMMALKSPILGEPGVASSLIGAKIVVKVLAHGDHRDDRPRPLQPGKILPSNQVEVLHIIVVGFYLPRAEAALGDLKVGRVADGTHIVSAKKKKRGGGCPHAAPMGPSIGQLPMAPRKKGKKKMVGAPTCRRVLAPGAPGGSWRPLAAPGGSWRLLAVSSSGGSW